MIVGVDLAASMSAGAILEDGQERPISWFDSVQNDEDTFVGIIARLTNMHDVWIEDIPPGVRFDLSTKDVCRLQGRIIDRATFPEKITWLAPIKWLRHFGWQSRAKSGSTAAFCKAKCEELGIDIPVGVHGKLLQDYRSAALIAMYARQVRAES